jgi:hypothetical protein
MPFPIPPAYHANRAANMLSKAADQIYTLTLSQPEDFKAAYWDSATGHLQDALAELGFDLVPLKPPAPATADSLYDDAAYAAGRGF